jgi:hypothetical protein
MMNKESSGLSDQASTFADSDDNFGILSPRNFMKLLTTGYE